MLLPRLRLRPFVLAALASSMALACGKSPARHGTRESGKPISPATTVNAAPVNAAAPPPAPAAVSAHGVTRICDIKRPLSGVDANPPLSEASYAAVLDAFKNQLGCSIVRLYIDPAISDPTKYPQLYRDVLQRTRVTLGLPIYVNPLGTGRFGMSNADYAAWILAYANSVTPNYLGPFNESGMRDGDLIDIAQRVRSGLKYNPILVGPDAQKVAGTAGLVAGNAKLSPLFQLLGSHNADEDEAATASAWSSLVAGANGMPVWSSENPRPLHVANKSGTDVGVAAAIAGGVGGVVLYEAFPTCVSADGRLTAKGTALANGM